MKEAKVLLLLLLLMVVVVVVVLFGCSKIQYQGEQCFSTVEFFLRRSWYVCTGENSAPQLTRKKIAKGGSSSQIVAKITTQLCFYTYKPYVCNVSSEN